MPSIKPGVPGHFSGYMLKPDHERVPRDWEDHMSVLQEAAHLQMMTGKQELCDSFSMHPHHTALAEMSMFNLWVQTGLTPRIKAASEVRGLSTSATSACRADA